MSRTFTTLFIFFFFLSCGKSESDRNNELINEEIVSNDEIQENTIPMAALNFEINLKLHDFNASQEDKILEAAELIKKVVATEEFKKNILSHTFKGKMTFNDNNGLSNAQIYKKILEGAEQLRPNKDNSMDLDLRLYHEESKTIGYTYPNVMQIWMNTKYLNQYSPAKITANMMHEWLHKLGFKHDVKHTPDRKYSVPYAIGHIVSRLASKISL